MSKRTSLLLPDEMYERLQRRARQHGTTVSDEIRGTLERECQEENPNQWLLDLAEEIGRHAVWSDAPLVDPDSDEAKVEMARSIYRDSMNREPDW